MNSVILMKRKIDNLLLTSESQGKTELSAKELSDFIEDLKKIKIQKKHVGAACIIKGMESLISNDSDTDQKSDKMKYKICALEIMQNEFYTYIYSDALKVRTSLSDFIKLYKKKKVKSPKILDIFLLIKDLRSNISHKDRNILYLLRELENECWAEYQKRNTNTVPLSLVTKYHDIVREYIPKS